MTSESVTSGSSGFEAGEAVTQQIPVQRGVGTTQPHGAAAAAGMSGEGDSLPPTAPAARYAAPGSGASDGGAEAEQMRTLAFKALSLVVGLALLVGCGFAVEHLSEWGRRWPMPLVFVLFVLVMLLASQLVVGGFTAVWAAARAGRK